MALASPVMIGSVTPLLLMAAGLVAFGAAAVTPFARFGPAFIGSVGCWAAIADRHLSGEVARAGGRGRQPLRGRRRPDRRRGRRSRTTHHRPLVFLRRTRLESARAAACGRVRGRRARRCRSRSSTGSTGSRVDADAIDEGLVVDHPRVRGHRRRRARTGCPPAPRRTTPVRLRVEQLSSVDHAIALRRAQPRTAIAGAGARAPGWGGRSS